jgi:glucosamine--fructose-6-phosphate aminotransferase (isomerizing)
MEASRYQTYREIQKTVPALKKVLERLFQGPTPLRRRIELGPRRWVFTGCGSSYYLGQAMALAMRRVLKREALACPASEWLLYPELLLANGEFLTLVGISRTGKTTETLRAVERAKELSTSCHTIGLTCSLGSPLAQIADTPVVLTEVEEEAIAMTHSFTALLFLFYWEMTAYAQQMGLRGDLSFDLLRGAVTSIEENLRVNEARIRQIATLHPLDSLIFLGAGPLYPIACEGALKATELALLPARSYHPLEFRHGPRATVNDRTLAFFLLSERGASVEEDLAWELQSLGATVVMVGPEVSSDFEYRLVVPPPPTEKVGAVHEPPLHDSLRSLLYLPLLQLFGFYKALSLGYNPDTPMHSDKSVILEGLAF